MRRIGHEIADKGRSPSDDPRLRLKLRGLATLSAHISTMKQLSAEADSIKSYSQNTFSLFESYTQLYTFSKVSYSFLEILSDDRHSKDVYIVTFFLLVS